MRTHWRRKPRLRLYVGGFVCRWHDKHQAWVLEGAIWKGRFYPPLFFQLMMGLGWEPSKG